MNLKNGIEMNHRDTETRRREGAFTLVELLVVIAIIGLLAALIIGGAGIANTKKITSRVKADMQAIENAIVAYHSKVGVYPPNAIHVPTGTNIPATPPLFYELTGTKSGIDNTGRFYSTIKGDEKIYVPSIDQIFGRQGFVNSNPEDARNFFPDLKPNQYREISTAPDVELLVVPAPGPNDFPDPTGGDKPINTWRYVSKNPTHNPNSYDLWAEVIIGGKTNIIGNWKE